MTDFCVDKHTITKKIISLIKLDYTSKDLKYAEKMWWNNIRSNGGLGLTKQGKEAFDLAGIEYWDIEIKISDIVKSSTKLKLDQYFPSPYYIFIGSLKPKVSPILRVYDSRIASLIMLHGNIIAYIESLKIKRTEMYLF